MIAYFSGTGNTEWVAQQLSTLVCDKRVVSLPSASPVDFSGTESLGICFPVHSWGIPSVVRAFMAQLPADHAIPYIYMVCTCGDDTGLTLEEFQHLLASRNQKGRLFCSVQMPNTYVNLPGFDVDPVKLQREKVRKASAQLKELAGQIRDREQKTCVVKGGTPWLKSKVIRPFFNRFLVRDSYFHAGPACTGCGTCERTCPVGNIHLQEKNPVWKQDGSCLTCMACYHACPQHAIRFGRFTEGKGQYLFKKLKIE